MGIRTILVPWDGSAFSEQAIPQACRIAERAGARVILVHVHVPPLELGTSEIPITISPEERREVEQASQQLLDAVVTRTAGRTSVAVAGRLLHGSITEAIIESANAESADLLVLTTHGRGAISRFWLGSVATDLLHRSSVPLLLVRPSDETNERTDSPKIRRMLVPLDGSEFGEQILPTAIEFGELLGLTHRLLRVIPPVLVGGWESPGMLLTAESTSQRLEKDAADYLSNVIERFPRLGGAEKKVVTDWPPAATILEEAITADMIAMSTHGRTGLSRVLLGGTADKVIRGTTLPVLVFRPGSAG